MGDRSGMDFKTPPDPTNPAITKTMTPAQKAQYAQGMANVRAALADSDAAAAKDYRERALAVRRAMNGGRSAPEAALTR